MQSIGFGPFPINGCLPPTLSRYLAYLPSAILDQLRPSKRPHRPLDVDSPEMRSVGLEHSLSAGLGADDAPRGREMRSGIIWLSTAFLAALLASQAPHSARAAADVVGSAVVLDDGSLRIRNTIVRLYGIYIPATGRSCAFFLRPVPCADRAALALETRIQGFVHCSAVSRNLDGSVNAICFIRRKFYTLGEDLAAYLLSRGFALALPGAPFEYLALERIAQTRQLGIWGFQVDTIVPGNARSR